MKMELTDPSILSLGSGSALQYRLTGSLAAYVRLLCAQSSAREVRTGGLADGGQAPRWGVGGW